MKETLASLEMEREFDKCEITVKDQHRRKNLQSVYTHKLCMFRWRFAVFFMKVHCAAKYFPFGRNEIVDSVVLTVDCILRQGINKSEYEDVYYSSVR